MMKTLSYFLFILLILTSCERGDGDLFGGASKTDPVEDLFGGGSTPPPTTPKKKKIEQVDKKTLGEKLLDVSVGIYACDETGALFSLGSGAFIKSNLIVTNVHVIEGISSIVAIRNSDQKRINVSINKVDRDHDVAILKTKNFKSEKYISFKTKFPHVGNEVWVAGAPEGLDGTISNGIISAIRKAKPFDFDLIQFTAPISFGSSGGPLINTDFELIGITVSGIDRNDAQNLNFAVPSKYISHLLDEENN